MSTLCASRACFTLSTKLRRYMSLYPVGLIVSRSGLHLITYDFVVAVLAFKAAYNMVRTKRDNDKRVLVIFEAMHDMFVALLQRVRPVLQYIRS